MLCSNCGKEPPIKTSVKRYCAECHQNAKDAWHRRMFETNQLREDKREAVKATIAAVEQAGLLSAKAATEDKFGVVMVLIQPGTCDIVKYMQKNGYPLMRAREGGVRLAAPAEVPTLKHWAWALGYCKKLQEYGYKCVPEMIRLKEPLSHE